MLFSSFVSLFTSFFLLQWRRASLKVLIVCPSSCRFLRIFVPCYYRAAVYALCPGISCLLSVPARACRSTDSSSWKSTYFQKIFRKKLQKDRCFRRINSQYEDSDKKLIKLLTRVVDDIRRQRHFGRSYKKRKETLFFFFFIFFFSSFFLFSLKLFKLFLLYSSFYIVEACMYIYVYDKLKITHISRFLIKKFVLFVFLSTKLLWYPMLDTISYFWLFFYSLLLLLLLFFLLLFFFFFPRSVSIVVS